MDKLTFEELMRLNFHRKDGAARCWELGRKVALGLSLTLACQCALAQAMYRIKPLGLLGGCTASRPYGVVLNEADEVAGYACNAHGDTHAFLWKNDGNPMVDLGPDEVGSFSEAEALNASGLVAGDAQDSTGQFAFLSSGDGTPMTRIDDGLGGSTVYPLAMNDLGQLAGTAYTAADTAEAFVWRNDGSPMLGLGSLGGCCSDGYAINASGQVAGNSDAATGTHAFVWKNDGKPMRDLGDLGGGYSYFSVMNASGEVAGSSDTVTYAHHAFLWRNDGTPMKDLGTLGGRDSYAYALNDSGQVAGFSNTYQQKKPHAFVWLNNGTPMKDLGTLGGTQSYTNDLNSSGQVTGWAYLPGNTISHAFLWRNDGTKIQDVNKLIDPTDPLKSFITLTSGDFINDLGDIAADGTDSRTGLQGLYLLQGTVLTLAPRSLAFGNQPINSTSAAKSVTMTNTSAKVVVIASIVLKGTPAGQFASTNNCGSSLVGHATCTIKVTFKPTTKGAKSATLNVNGGGGGLRSVTLTGTGS